MATYSEVVDLLLGDLTVSASIDRSRVVQDATDEIDACIGFIYELPLSPTPSGHIKLTLKRCANLIASGRLVMAVAAGGEDTSLHAYGESLLREGRMLLESIESGQIDLGCTKKLVYSEGNAPSITNADSTSAVDAFYAYVSSWPFPHQHDRSGVPIWKPNA